MLLTIHHLCLGGGWVGLSGGGPSIGVWFAEPAGGRLGLGLPGVTSVNWR